MCSLKKIHSLHSGGGGLCRGIVYRLRFPLLSPTAMGAFLPNLNVIALRTLSSDERLEGEDLARLLSASRRGWKSIDIMGGFYFGEQSWQALSQHTLTLENFRMRKWYCEEGTAPGPFLTSFLRLQSFVTLAKGELNSMDANAWIHQDPSSGSLTPWPCEYSLKDLRIKITGIPRPDVTHDYRGKKRQPAVEESYSGEGRMMQRRVRTSCQICQLGESTPLASIFLPHPPETCQFFNTNVWRCRSRSGWINWKD